MIVTGPSVVTFNTTWQFTRARATLIATVATFVAVRVIVSLTGAAGTGPHVLVKLV